LLQQPAELGYPVINPMGVTGHIPFVIWLIVMPLTAAAMTFVANGRLAVLLIRLIPPLILLASVGLTLQVGQDGPLRYASGGWGAPLGIDLYADGLACVMLVMTASVGVPVSCYAKCYFSDRQDIHSARFFWPLWFFLWAAMNALYLSTDIFNLYVTLELLGLAAVSLVALAGTPAALTAALRYLLVALLGSLAYLMGVAVCYGIFGTLDLVSIRLVATPGLPAATAFTLMTVGLLLKTALFPLHYWLPPAHANAPAPVSAILSGLVVTASFYLLLRLWYVAFPCVPTHAVGEVIGWLGAAAVLWGSVQSLIANRFKLIVAYSTVAQLGYLFLLFPLASSDGLQSIGWAGGVYMAVSHALAKAAVFLAAGNVRRAAGHDHIARLGGLGQPLAVSFMAVALAAVSLIGLPPSGGFAAKWMLLSACVDSERWWFAAVLLLGGLLSAGYWFRVLVLAFTREAIVKDICPVPMIMEVTALLLALAAIALGFVAEPIVKFLWLGATITDTGVMP
jgi:formate hydrogenlyase subunit 3/multisubunit Na+/H+ antiporter MnhD subunit